MGGYLFGSAAGQPGNPDRTYKKVNMAAGGVTLTNSNGANALGAYTSLIGGGGLPEDASALILTLGLISSTTARAQINLRKNGSTIILPSYYHQGLTNQLQKVRIPLKVATAATLDAAVRTSANGASVVVGLEYEAASTSVSPGFDNVTDFGFPNNTVVRASTTDLPNTSTGAWTEWIADTGANPIGALLAAASDHSTAPTSSRTALFEMSLGTAGNEDSAIFWEGLARLQSTAPYVIGGNWPLIEHLIPAHSRISVRQTVGTGDSDLLRFGLWGFY